MTLTWTTPFLSYLPQYHKQWKNQILHGDIFQLIHGFPDHFFWSSIFSPPYWNLRDYGTPPIIFNADQHCNHIWVQFLKKGTSGGTSRKTYLGQKQMDNFQIVKDSNEAICMKCGALKSSFGLEPFVLDHTFEFEENHPVIVKGYNSHLTELCHLLMQKTRLDGSLWINLGDSYSTQGGQNITNSDEYTDYASIHLNNRMIGKQLLKSPEFPNKSLCLMPERFALTMLEQYGYVIRSVIIWKKNNPMTTSSTDRFTRDFENWYFIVHNNPKPFYWVNQKTMEMVTTHPMGRSGEEGIDWEWGICEDCLVEVEKDIDLLPVFLEPNTTILKTMTDIPMFLSFIGNLTPAQLSTQTFKQVCHKKQSCIDGKIKRSLWRSYDYYFEQQFDPLASPEYKLTKNARNKHTKYGSKTYSGFLYNSQDFLHGKNKRTTWMVNTKGTGGKHIASYSTDIVKTPIDASVPKFFCTKCGLPRIKVYEFEKTDPFEIYKGIAKKQYELGKAQNPSDTKRRILQSLRKIRKLKGYSHCQCDNPIYEEGFGFDPFTGIGTTPKQLLQSNEAFIGCELQPDYITEANDNLKSLLEKTKFQKLDRFQVF